MGLLWSICLCLFLNGCTTSEHAQTARTVICDYGSQFIYEAKKNGSEKAIADALAVLKNKDAALDDPQRLATDFLYRDDEILPFLRSYLSSGKDDLEAKWLLCFCGDKSDFEKFDIPAFAFKLPEHPVSAIDLSEALALFRDSKKLITTSFRTTGLVYNRTMTKAFVQALLGPGAFNCSGWGLMFHRIQGKWVLMWSRFEWVS